MQTMPMFSPLLLSQDGETCEPSNYKPVYLKYFFFVSIVSSLEENVYLVQKEQYGSRDLAALIATRQYSELLI